MNRRKVEVIRNIIRKCHWQSKNEINVFYFKRKLLKKPVFNNKINV